MAPGKEATVNVKAFAAAWLGWAFDGLDGYLYALVAVPFVTELVGSKAAAKEPASWVQAAFLVGWALGGAIFGRIGDKLGRSRTLSLTILTYAVFTGLSAAATSWQMLLVFRFISALGIGGEWAAGSALVSETLDAKHRAWGSALLQTGFQAGMIGAAATIGIFAHWNVHYDPRYVFLVGVLPAVLTLWIRYAVPEPEAWALERREKEMPQISNLFAPALRRTTLLALALSCICLTTVWAFLFFNVQIIQALPEFKTQGPALVTWVTIEFTLCNVVGNFAASFIAKWIGYRKAFALYMALSGATFLLGFNRPLTLTTAQIWFDLYMFFGSAIFGIFPLYFPLLFPTLLRTTGAGFCYNFGRLIAAVGTLGLGWVTAHIGPALALWYMGFLYLPGILVAMLMPEVGKE